MRNNPPFEITNAMIDHVAEIAELVGRLTSMNQLSANPSASDEMSDGTIDKATMRWKQIEKFLETHEFIMNADVRELCGVSTATANRILSTLVREGKLVKCRESGHWAYRYID